VNILTMGPPASGKTTQAALIAERLHIPMVTASAALKAGAKEDLAQRQIIEQAMALGALVPDEIVAGLVIGRLRQPDCSSGFVVDGFPRSLGQAAALAQAGVHIDIIIELILDEADVLRRVTGRRIHGPSGRTYHLIFDPPKNDERDDVTGELLLQRDDDREDVVSRRLELYETYTEPVRRYYASMPVSAPRYFRIDGTGDPSDVSERVFSLLSPLIK
jgi:adenylate kinase